MTDLTSLARVKIAAGIPTGTTTSDALINQLLPGITAAVQRKYGREFVAPVGNPLTRRVRSSGRNFSLAPWDLQSASAIVLDPAGAAVSLAATDWRLGTLTYPGATYRGVDLRRTYAVANRTITDYGYVELDITGTWGFASVPEDVQRAADIVATSWIDKAASEYGIDADGVPGGIAPDFSTTWAIPMAAHTLLFPYQRQEF